VGDGWIVHADYIAIAMLQSCTHTLIWAHYLPDSQLVEQFTVRLATLLTVLQESIYASQSGECHTSGVLLIPLNVFILSADY